VPVADALQATRDALEAAMSLGRARPLVAIREGEVVLVSAAATPARRAESLAAARARVLDEHDVDVRCGASGPAPGFPGVPRAYREAALSVSHASAAHPIVSLADLSAIDCLLVGADAATRAAIAAKGARLRALPADELAQTEATVHAFAAADLNVARAAAALYVHPNTVRYRLARIADTTGQDPRTFEGLTELVCVLEALGETAGDGLAGGRAPACLSARARVAMRDAGVTVSATAAGSARAATGRRGRRRTP
jgi:sugar diacid utilization regulator